MGYYVAKDITDTISTIDVPTGTGSKTAIPTVCDPGSLSELLI